MKRIIRNPISYLLLLTILLSPHISAPMAQAIPKILEKVSVAPDLVKNAGIAFLAGMAHAKNYFRPQASTVPRTSTSAPGVKHERTFISNYKENPWAQVRPPNLEPITPGLPDSPANSPWSAHVSYGPHEFAEFNKRSQEYAHSEQKALVADAVMQRFDKELYDRAFSALQTIADTAPTKHPSLWRLVQQRLEMNELHIQDARFTSIGKREQLLNEAQRKLTGCYYEANGTLKHPKHYDHQCPTAAIGNLYESFPKQQTRGGEYNWKKTLKSSGAAKSDTYIKGAESWLGSRPKICDRCVANQQISYEAITQNATNAAYYGVVKAWELNDPRHITFLAECAKDQLFNDLIHEYAHKNPYCAADLQGGLPQTIIERAIAKKNLEQDLNIPAAQINELNELNYQILECKSTTYSLLNLVNTFVQSHQYIPNINTIYFGHDGVCKLLDIDAPTRAQLQPFIAAKLSADQRYALNLLALARIDLPAEQPLIDAALVDLLATAKGASEGRLYRFVVNHINQRGSQARGLVQHYLKEVYGANRFDQNFRNELHARVLTELNGWDLSEVKKFFSNCTPNNPLFSLAHQCRSQEQTAALGHELIELFTSFERMKQAPLTTQAFSEFGDFRIDADVSEQSQAIYNDCIRVLEKVLPLRGNDALTAEIITAIKSAHELNCAGKLDEAVRILYPLLRGLGIKPTIAVGLADKISYWWSRIEEMDPVDREHLARYGCGAATAVAVPVAAAWNAAHTESANQTNNGEPEAKPMASAGGGGEPPEDPWNGRGKNNRVYYGDWATWRLKARFAEHCANPATLGMAINNGNMTVSHARDVLQQAEKAFSTVPGYEAVLRRALIETLENIDVTSTAMGALFEFETALKAVAQGENVVAFGRYGFDVVTGISAIECKNVNFPTMSVEAINEMSGRLFSKIKDLPGGLKPFFASRRPIPVNLSDAAQQARFDNFFNRFFEHGGKFF